MLTEPTTNFLQILLARLEHLPWGHLVLVRALAIQVDHGGIPISIFMHPDVHQFMGIRAQCKQLPFKF